MTGERSMPHHVIVGQTGNTFGTGDELARDILWSFQAQGLDIVDGQALAEVNDYLRAQHMEPLVSLLAQDISICHRTRYGRSCTLPRDHDGIHVDGSQR